ncbi:hypothetical protein SAMN05216330_102431 [Bradyrhizobium sp. Ghvi]|uniref:hypothetical protein n=1 Tax=Bradyrhizobium sp. Ghvi TaxID=1855319 RepID=UPI0008E56BE2|nr:hypothetical protein [Bradyrhizobium sp. Ghvi]SFO25675.1 hypothetical protein SAMN05216330_102431 [Bradyrhizobium sp. Ghvi]
MSQRSPSPYARAGTLIRLVHDLHSFCRQHQHGEMAGGMTYDELFQIEHQLTEALSWVQQLGPSRAPNARAAEQTTTVDEEVF